LNIVELKAYIIQNDKIPQILEAAGCTSIKKSKKYYSCATPLNTKPQSTTVRRSDLKIKIWADNPYNIRGDIFNLVSALLKISLGDTIKFVHEIFGFSYDGFSEITQEQIELLHSLKENKDKVPKLEFYTEKEILKYYTPMPYIGWIREGILPSSMQEFKIGYSKIYNRIIIPHRYYKGRNKKNNYIGLVGRTLIDEYKELGIPKYFPIISYPKTLNLYGLYENKEYIKKAGYVNVFEAEKSVLKRHSRLDKTGVALGCHTISDVQVEILLALNVDIIIQMDSDVPLNEIYAICEKFYGKRKVYYIHDEFGLLGNKESPADKHNKIYWVLWNRKKLYGAEEHERFLNMEFNKKIKEVRSYYA